MLIWFLWIWIRIQHFKWIWIHPVLMTKNGYLLWSKKLLFTYRQASIKDVQASGEAFRSQRRTPSTSKDDIYKLLYIFQGHFYPPGSKSGSTTLHIYVPYTYFTPLGKGTPASVLPTWTGTRTGPGLTWPPQQLAGRGVTTRRRVRSWRVTTISSRPTWSSIPAERGRPRSLHKYLLCASLRTSGLFYNTGTGQQKSIVLGFDIIICGYVILVL